MAEPVEPTVESRVLDMFLGGATYRQTADRLGMDADGVEKAVNQRIEALLADKTPMKRTEARLQMPYAEAMRGDPQAARTCLQILTAPPPKPSSDAGSVTEWLEQAHEEGALEQDPSMGCRICREPAVRSLVNHMITIGYGATDIVSALAEHNHKLKAEGKRPVTSMGVRHHREHHFDIQAPAAALWRRMQEKRALEHGRDWKEGVGTILNAMSYYETMAVRGYENLVDPSTEVSYRDGAAAVLKLHELSKGDEDEFERARMLSEMGRVVDVVRSFIPQDQWPAVQAMLRGEAPARQEAQAVESVRVVDIDDTPDSGED